MSAVSATLRGGKEAGKGASARPCRASGRNNTDERSGSPIMNDIWEETAHVTTRQKERPALAAAKDSHSPVASVDVVLSSSGNDARAIRSS